MSLRDLQQWLVELPAFRNMLDAVMIRAAAEQFPMLAKEDASPPAVDWPYLLECANILSSSDSEIPQSFALRLSQQCLQSADTGPVEKDVATFVLDKLSNGPAIDLAVSRQYTNGAYQERLPLPLLQDSIRKGIESSVMTRSGRVRVNRFQREFWKAASENTWVSVSAPTSAGKSFILKRWIAESILEPEAVVVYIVPTRALIAEVEDDLRSHLKSERIRVNLTSLPHSFKPNGLPSIFVFTQERLHLLFQRFPDMRPTLVIVDEAQKFGDRQRGLLLLQVVDECVRRNSNAKVLLASPMVSNPEVLLRGAPDGIRRTTVSSAEVTVNQNLVWVSQMPRTPLRWKVELKSDDDSVRMLGTLTLKHSPASSGRKRLSFVAESLGSREGGNVIYVNGAAEAEIVARQVFELLGAEADVSGNQEIRDLIEAVKVTVHKQYALSEVLQRGVAFHYGNMPLLLRAEIERLFKTNVIKYLVCTSTLLEGVNLPCKNLFVRGPQRGLGNYLGAGDFWNLAGRAGRWGKEFEGNIVCIEPESPGAWRDGPPPRKRRDPVELTATRVLERNTSAFLAYLQSREIPDGMENLKREFDAVESFLVANQRINGRLESPWFDLPDSQEALGIRQMVTQASQDASVIPSEVIWRNPGVSPVAMARLLSYFDSRDIPTEELLPAQVGSSDAVAVYSRIFHRVNNYLEAGAFGTKGMVQSRAITVTNWMRGFTLARLIRAKLDYYGEERKQNVASVIRDVMRDVEEIARFVAPKFLQCYVDVLRLHLSRVGKEELLNDLPDFAVVLELGVAETTQISLLSLGLSRTSAVMISELIVETELSEEQCLERLRSIDLEAYEIPALVRREVARILAAAA